ncbi:Structural maintenance of chromosomes protein 2 [Spiromyces aspiralis]|uniref:Structural maintenance of chromosomes protein 2 n=1 Tax=Spiromyces aspiralis TaxID=68401 RepID=A0ACC1HVM4_9FUNG|nr:Structural maintenance of chromosomes protein 2 [Spiromyces aspiralis]
MRVEELIIDGFKSYATRTHITGWDAEFNAITGLNGSGKSNILDAICFALGIKNMKLATSVTIVFNNEDRKASPLGYEDCKQISLTRQIMVGGKNKYLINGHNAQEQAVYNMLQSVQLNINNPHFLIMQGKITQVLNMQPPEILAMIEEAAGTRMFEERKEKALKTIAKKERKIEEITTILSDEITPKLDKLRKQKKAYLEFKNVEIELDRLRRLVVAYDYTKYEERLAQGSSLLENAKSVAMSLQRRIDTLKADLELIVEKRKVVEAKRTEEMRKDGTFRQLESKVNTLSKTLVKIKTQLDLKAASAREEESKKTALLQTLAEASLPTTCAIANLAIRDLKKSMEKLGLDSEKAESKYKELKAVHDDKSAQIQQLEELIQSLTTGVALDEGREGGFMQQLQEAKDEANASATTIEQAKLKLQLLERELKELTSRSKKAKSEDSGLLDKQARIESRINDYESQLAKANFDPKAQSDLEARRSKYKHELTALQEKHQELKSRLRGFDFQYTDPIPNFDRTRVKGLVAQLFTIKEANKHATDALELCAGGQLFNVVVQDDQTGALLLERGRLRQRFTILPLNRLTSKRADARVVEFAKSLVPGKVDLAISLIDFDSELEPAMAGIFGNILVCKDAATAKKVAFHKDVRMKCITLEGDLYDPAGTLQGGTKPQSAGILDRVHTLSQLTKEVGVLEAELSRIDGKLVELRDVSETYQRISQDMGLARHELSLVQQQRMDEIKKELQEQRDSIDRATKRLKESKDRVGSIEKEMKEFRSDKHGKLKELEARLNKLRREFPKAQKSLKETQSLAQDASLKKENLEAEMKEVEEQVAAIDQSLAEIASDQVDIKQQLVATKNDLDESQAQLDKASKQLRLYDRELNEFDESFKQKQAEMRDAQLELQKQTHEIEQHSETQAKAESSLQHLAKEHPWIEDEKQ